MELKKEVNGRNAKEKTKRSISLAGGDLRKVSFAKKSTSESDATNGEASSKRRSRSADFSAAASSFAVSKGSKTGAKSAQLFSISEHVGASEQSTDDVIENKTATADVPHLSDELLSLAQESLTTDMPLSLTEESGNEDKESESLDSAETPSDLPEITPSSGKTRSCRASSATSSDMSSASSTSSFPNSASLSNISRPSTSTRSTSSTIRFDSAPRFRRTSTQQSIGVGDANSRLLRMALRREWTQLEISLRYMNKADPGLYVVDDVSRLK